MRTSDARYDKRRAPLAAQLPKAAKASAGPTSASDTPATIYGLKSGATDEALRRRVRQRLGFKLGKFADRITRVTVRFIDVSGPKGAPTVACRIASFLTSGTVVVEARSKQREDAFDQASDSHERAVRRLLERKDQAARRPRKR
ncbi:MAG: HPF/RaiA family ribosome-associated protein [Gemmatimonadota bacterium]